MATVGDDQQAAVPARAPDARLLPAPVLRKTVGALLVAALGLLLFHAAPTLPIAWVCVVLLLTFYLFVTEVVAVDVAAITVMVLLGLSSLAAPLLGLEQGLVDPDHLFDGFSSNAVVSIIAVMILGAGLDKTGIMNRVAALILRVGGTSEQRIIPILSGTVGAISSFMQNVGAAALFLPVVNRISARSGVSMSRLLMPMGFCAILGGTMTMVGSSPLILLNDLIIAGNDGLDPEDRMAIWPLFSTAPIGLVLVLVGITYFVVAGPYVLPNVRQDAPSSVGTMQYVRDLYGIDYDLFEVVVPPSSPLVGMTLQDVETPSEVIVIATRTDGVSRVGPGAIARDVGFRPGMTLGIVASPEALEHFVEQYRLVRRPQIRTFMEELSSLRSGIAEIVIPPNSSLVGQSARDVWMRKRYGIVLVALHRGGETLREADGVRRMPLRAGDTLVVHTTWEALSQLKGNRDFVIVTTEYPHEELRPQKVHQAALFFVLSLSLVMFSDLRLSLALLSGAIGMVLTGVLRMEEAYQAVNWRTVFLLASLLPLGLAVETSGTARWVAELVIEHVGAAPVWVIQLALASVATAFTLVMSNVAATVLLVPLAISIAVGVEADPAQFALLVALATSNSFLIPTHQVNALIMGPGGYAVRDFLRAGSCMTVLFLVVLVAMMNVLY